MSSTSTGGLSARDKLLAALLPAILVVGGYIYVVRPGLVKGRDEAVAKFEELKKAGPPRPPAPVPTAKTAKAGKSGTGGAPEFEAPKDLVELRSTVDARRADLRKVRADIAAAVTVCNGFAAGGAIAGTTAGNGGSRVNGASGGTVNGHHTTGAPAGGTHPGGHGPAARTVAKVEAVLERHRLVPLISEAATDGGGAPGILAALLPPAATTVEAGPKAPSGRPPSSARPGGAPANFDGDPPAGGSAGSGGARLPAGNATAASAVARRTDLVVWHLIVDGDVSRFRKAADDIAREVPSAIPLSINLVLNTAEEGGNRLLEVWLLCL